MKRLELYRHIFPVYISKLIVFLYTYDINFELDDKKKI
jgi:hypothetical protein